MPCKQILTDKIDSTDIWLTTAKNLQAYANGDLTAVINIPGNKLQYRWHSSYPVAYYLITIGVGKYAVLNDEALLPDGKKLPLLFYLYNNAKFIKNEKNNMLKTKYFVQLLDSLFGTYPFDKEKYGVALAQIPDIDGMENQTISVNVDLRPWLNIHELQHQWFGNMVTCKSFDDIWLHEGFATYSEMLGMQLLPKFFVNSYAEWVAVWHSSVVSKPGGTVHVPQEDLYNENRIFDERLTYDKGGSLVHMLRFEINNDSIFFSY